MARLLELGGVAAVIIGLYLVFPPLAWVIAGLYTVASASLLQQRD